MDAATIDDETVRGRSRVRELSLGVREWARDLVQRRWSSPVALALLTLYSVYSRVYSLKAPCDHPCRPPGGAGLIFDETYYVNAARIILGWHVPNGDNYAGDPSGYDPNSEHPQLAKLAIAGGMKLFGDTPLGWRFGSIVMGTVAILAMYFLVRAARGSRGLALGAAAVMSLDNLAMVHGRIGTLDIYALAFGLVAVALYLRGHPLIAGLVLGVGMCTKETALYMLVVLGFLEIARGFHARATGEERWLRTILLRQAWMIGATAVAFVGLLEVLDVFVRPYDDGRHVYYTNVFSHIHHIVTYAAQQRSPNGPSGVASYPWQWWINEKKINYFTVTTTVRSGGDIVSQHAVISFQGAMNPFLILVAVPAIAATAHLWWRTREVVDLLPVAWVAGTWLPLLGQSLFDQRTSYLYYMVLVLPGVYLAAARFFSMRAMPRLATVAWALTLVGGFFALYPIRTPNW